MSVSLAHRDDVGHLLQVVEDLVEQFVRQHEDRHRWDLLFLVLERKELLGRGTRWAGWRESLGWGRRRERAVSKQ
jgi:hypothetical protein